MHKLVGKLEQLIIKAFVYISMQLNISIGVISLFAFHLACKDYISFWSLSFLFLLCSIADSDAAKMHNKKNGKQIEAL